MKIAEIGIRPEGVMLFFVVGFVCLFFSFKKTSCLFETQALDVRTDFFLFYHYLFISFSVSTASLTCH